MGMKTLATLYEIRAQAVSLAVDAACAGEFRLSEKAADDAQLAQESIDKLLQK